MQNGSETVRHRSRSLTRTKELVLGEHFLDLLRIVGLCQSQLQEQAGFLRIQRIAVQEAFLGVLIVRSRGCDDTAANAAGANHHHAFLHSVDQTHFSVLVDGTVAGTGRDDTFGAGLHSGVNQDGVVIGV